MNISKEQAYWAAVKSDFKIFLIHAFRELHPGTNFLDNWHIDAIVNCLELSIEGKMRRLIINMPPRQLKSFIVSVAFPAFLLGLDPSVKIICVSYGDDLAKDLARKTRRLLQSAWYKKLYPKVNLVKTAESEIETDEGGIRYATSVGGTLTGKGGDFIIIDDPSKPTGVESDSARSATNDWYRNTLLSRLDDKKYGVLIVVMQRLHVNDLTGFIEDGGEFYKLSFPAIATKNETIPTRNGSFYTRKIGEPLHAERESVEMLNKMRAQMGSFLFSAQYQQTPETPEGGIFKRKYFKMVDQMPETTELGYVCVSIDCAMSSSDQADYTAITVAYIEEGRYTVFEVQRGRWDYEHVKVRALRYIQRFGSEVIFVVEAANVGIALASYLLDKHFRSYPYKPVDSKLGRAAQMLPVFEAGQVNILNIEGKNEWVEPLLNEFVSFPGCRHDDQVDSLIQLLWFAKKNPYPSGRVILC